MSSPSDHEHPVRRVVLPSGKTIEFVYFPGSQDGRAAAAHDLDVCPHCGSAMVHPVGWEDAGDERWRLHLRCPECEWSAEGEFGADEVERLDASLDRGMRVMVRDLKRFVQANMEDELERFISALQADQIWPIDF
jgi:hypothetical protein